MTEEERRAGVQGLVSLLPESDRAALGQPFDDAAAMRVCLKLVPFAAAVLARARYAEDRFAEALDTGVAQYVLVGAGMDTFAFRRPELQKTVQVFEVHFPASQSFKADRLAQVGLSTPPNLHFVPVDLEREDLAQCLSTSPFDVNKPAFFVWLGVTPYLHSDTILRTLGTISHFACPGSQIVFDFIDVQGLDPDTTSDRIRRFQEFLSRMGEPAMGALDASNIASTLSSVGYELVEHLSPNIQKERYFLNRSDGLGPTEYYHFVCARVSG